MKEEMKANKEKIKKVKINKLMEYQLKSPEGQIYYQPIKGVNAYLVSNRKPILKIGKLNLQKISDILSGRNRDSEYEKEKQVDEVCGKAAHKYHYTSCHIKNTVTNVYDDIDVGNVVICKELIHKTSGMVANNKFYVIETPIFICKRKIKHKNKTTDSSNGDNVKYFPLLLSYGTIKITIDVDSDDGTVSDFSFNPKLLTINEIIKDDHNLKNLKPKNLKYAILDKSNVEFLRSTTFSYYTATEHSSRTKIMRSLLNFQEETISDFQ